ncbi:MAG: SprT family zinc-dependent metalloprotease [Candidatus Paceibacterota bacterium]
MKEFIFGTFVYEYTIIRQDRKTLALTVTPDLKIIVKCPYHVDSNRIDIFLRKKWFWLEKQLSFFKKYQRKLYDREYVSGESYLYLGRQYKLVVKKSNKNKIILTKGKLLVYTKKSVSSGQHNKKLIDSWFLDKTEKVFPKRFLSMVSLFDYNHHPALRVRDMKKRWGSFLNKEKIFLNPKLIHVSGDCIDYVIVHELCHLRYKKHDKRFFDLLNEKYPKWKKAKDKLETIGAGLCRVDSY